jgi:hypothetical protein
MVNWNYTRLFSTHFNHVEIYHMTALFMAEINPFQPYSDDEEVDVMNLHLYTYLSHAFYFLPHDYSYDIIFLISLSMLIINIAYLYSDGILLDLHCPL